jgi:hypothetical protein
VTCLALSRDQFFQLLGPLQELLNSQHEQRQEVERTVRALHSFHGDAEPTVLARASSFLVSTAGKVALSPSNAQASAMPRQFTFTEAQMKISATVGESPRRASLPDGLPSARTSDIVARSEPSTLEQVHPEVVSASPIPTPIMSPPAADGASATLSQASIATSHPASTPSSTLLSPDLFVSPVTGLPSLSSLQKSAGAGSIAAKGSGFALTSHTAPAEASNASNSVNVGSAKPADKVVLAPTAAQAMSQAASTVISPASSISLLGSSLAPIAEEGKKKQRNSGAQGAAVSKPIGTLSAAASAYTTLQVGTTRAATATSVATNPPSLSPHSSGSSTSLRPAAQTLASGGAGTSGDTPGAKKGLSATPYSSLRSLRPDLRLSDIEFIATLGEGAFGLVRLVRNRNTGEIYALKQMQKARIVATNQQRNVMNEKRILSKLKHPYIIEFVKTFKDRDCLFLLSEYCPGGDLFGTLIRAGGILATPDATWYAAAVTLVLEYLHGLDIVYRYVRHSLFPNVTWFQGPHFISPLMCRDLKPENLLLDREGFLKVCDFGFAKVVTDRTYTLCGTPEYLAPELVQSRGHGKGVDWWALGTLFHCLCMHAVCIMWML